MLCEGWGHKPSTDISVTYKLFSIDGFPYMLGSQDYLKLFQQKPILNIKY